MQRVDLLLAVYRASKRVILDAASSDNIKINKKTKRPECVDLGQANRRGSTASDESWKDVGRLFETKYYPNQEKFYPLTVWASRMLLAMEGRIKHVTALPDLDSHLFNDQDYVSSIREVYDLLLSKPGFVGLANSLWGRGKPVDMLVFHIQHALAIANSPQQPDSENSAISGSGACASQDMTFDERQKGFFSGAASIYLGCKLPGADLASYKTRLFSLLSAYSRLLGESESANDVSVVVENARSLTLSPEHPPGPFAGAGHAYFSDDEEGMSPGARAGQVSPNGFGEMQSPAAEVFGGYSPATGRKGCSDSDEGQSPAAAFCWKDFDDEFHYCQHSPTFFQRACSDDGSEHGL